MSDASPPSPTDLRNGTGPATIDDCSPDEPPDRRHVYDELATVTDPRLDSDLVSLGLVEDVRIGSGIVAVWLGLYAPHAPDENRMVQDVHRCLDGESRDVATFAASRIRDHPDRCRPFGVRNVVPFLGTADGVGTTTVAANVAVALADHGARVGLFDADLTGPDARAAFDPDAGSGTPGFDRTPSTYQGVRVLGGEPDPDVVLADASSPGELYAQVCREAAWGELDYLLVDLGAEPVVQEAFLDTVGTDGAVVTVPESAAPREVNRCRQHLRDAGVPLLGIVENEPIRDEARRDAQSGKPDGDRTTAPSLGSVPHSEPLWNSGVCWRAFDDGLADAFADVADEVTNAVGRYKRARHARLAATTDA